MGELIKHLIEAGNLKSKEIITAFEAIDRKDFVPSEHQAEAYGDYPLPIGRGQTISQPTTVAIMLELLQPQRGEKILDVGSGSGWTTALLAQIVGKEGKVFGLEKIAELAEFSKNNLKKYHLPQAEIFIAGKELGLPAQAPFDRILVSAAAQELPQSLVDQLKPDGAMVIPVNDSVWQVRKLPEGKLAIEKHWGFSFVPLV